MIGVALQRVHMRHLDDGEQRQQCQAHKHSHAESTWLPATLPAELCLEFCLQNHSYHKDTQYWTRSQRLGFQFPPSFHETAAKKAGLSPTFFADCVAI
jgi:hypothetical protein